MYIKYPNGHEYDGEFKEGKKCGNGIYRGTHFRYDGEWKDGKMDG